MLVDCREALPHAPDSTDYDAVEAWPVTDYPVLGYSMKRIRRVGEALAGDVVWSPEREPEIREIFEVANNWRDAHLYPMTKLRHELIGTIRKMGLQGVTGARLKRMHSIRKKLRTHPGNLSQIQDLGGCRAILPSIAAVRSLVANYKADDRHEFDYEDDYIATPKPGGYRCHHIILKFRGGYAEHEGRRIEIQIRTRLQHSWATAVEAVGTFRNEDMKAGLGDKDWLRLFELMSAEIAVAEKCPEPPNVPRRSERTKEIRVLRERLNAAQMLENLRQAVRFTDRISRDAEPAPYYLIKYDSFTREVEVHPYYKPLKGTAAYDSAELDDNLQGTSRFNTVLVEAGKIEALKEAYPNYFGDVRLFTSNLAKIVKGHEAVEYTMPPRIVEPPPRHPDADMSWLRRTARQKHRFRR